MLSVARRPLLYKAWSLADLPGVKRWYQADRIGLADASAVGSWVDISGNGRTLSQATEAAKPTLTFGQINGFPAVIGDGVDDFIGDAITDGWAAPNWVLAVLKFVSWTAFDYVWIGGAANTLIGYQVGAASKLTIYSGATGPATSSDLGTSAYHVVAAQYNGASSTLRLNGAAASVGDVGANVTATGFRLFSSMTPGNWGNAAIAEIIVGNGVLGPALEDQAIRHLGRRYGIAVSV